MATEVAERTAMNRVGGALGNQQFILFLVWVGMVVLFSVINPQFFSIAVASNILADWGPVVLVAVGQLFVVISAGIDLSVGAVAGFSGVIAALLMRSMYSGGEGQAPWLVLLVGLIVCAGVGLAVGLVNSLLINYAKLVPFVATLVTLGAASGLSLVITGGGPVGGGPPAAIQLSVPVIGPFSWPIIGVIVVVTIAGAFLHKARFGRYTYALGSNSFAARAAGISVKGQIAKVYMLSGLLAGLAGYFFYLRLGSGAPTSGGGMELDAIAAVVIGGAALAGGVGRMSGTVLGALILTTVTSGLIMIGVQPSWKRDVVAVLIAVAVAIQAARRSDARAS